MSERSRASLIFTLLLASERHAGGQFFFKPQDVPPRFDWSSYHSLEAIYDFLHEKAQRHRPHSRVLTIGRSHQGRPIKVLALTVGGGGDNGTGVRNVFFEGGMHAREWASPPGILYILQNILLFRKYAETFHIYVLPVANPDGYEYTRRKDVAGNNRLWRKNLNLERTGRGDLCVLDEDAASMGGVDLNRNFGYKWNVTGTDDNCDETYPGTAAFSEKESQAVRDFYLSLEPRPELAMAIHSYQQSVSYQYGHERGAVPNRPNLHRALCFRVAEVLRGVEGRNYTCLGDAPGDDSAPATSGSSDDWYKSLDTGVTFLLELRPATQEEGGFELPPDKLLGAAKESWAMAQFLMDYLIEQGGAFELPPPTQPRGTPPPNGILPFPTLLPLPNWAPWLEWPGIGPWAPLGDERRRKRQAEEES